MLIVHVTVHVKDGMEDAFLQATLENARNSVREPGIARFDVIRQLGQKSKFMLLEEYRTDDAPAQHKETAHYKKWRDTVANMMAEPRTSMKFENLYPGDDLW